MRDNTLSIWHFLSHYLSGINVSSTDNTLFIWVNLNIVILVGTCVSCTEAPTTTQPPTTSASTATPSTEPTQTPSTPQPTTATTVPTLPPTTPLPQTGSRAVEAVLGTNFVQNVDGWKAAGYAPVNINAYTIRGHQYFTIVYTFVGSSEAAQCYVYSDLTIQNADYYIRNQPAYLQLKAMAAYSKNGQVNMALVFGPASDVRIVSLDKSSQEWLKEAEEMSEKKYYPVCIRFSQADSGSRIYTIYQKDTPTSFEWGLSLGDLQQRIDDRRLYQNSFVTDLSYEVLPDGDARYAAVFSNDRFGNDQFRIDLVFDRYNFYYSNTALQESKYHAVALTPVIQKHADPGYLTAYWR